jgi:hypothetical protein
VSRKKDEARNDWPRMKAQDELSRQEEEQGPPVDPVGNPSWAEVKIDLDPEAPSASRIICPVCSVELRVFLQGWRCGCGK